VCPFPITPGVVLMLVCCRSVFKQLPQQELKLQEGSSRQCCWFCHCAAVTRNVSRLAARLSSTARCRNHGFVEPPKVTCARLSLLPMRHIVSATYCHTTVRPPSTPALAPLPPQSPRMFWFDDASVCSCLSSRAATDIRSEDMSDGRHGSPGRCPQ
jgi:hypothetical protein